MDEIAEKIRDTLSIEEVCDLLGIDIYRHKFILCPIHEQELGRPDTKATNCTISDGYFYCYACGKGGDIFSLYQAVNNCSFYTAKNELARYAGIEIKSSTLSKKEYQPLPNESLKILGFHRAAIQKLYEYDLDLYKKVVFERCDKLISIYENSIEAYKTKQSSGIDELYEICEVNGILEPELLARLNSEFILKLNSVRLIKNTVASL